MDDQDGAGWKPVETTYEPEANVFDHQPDRYDNGIDSDLLKTNTIEQQARIIQSIAVGPRI